MFQLIRKAIVDANDWIKRMICDHQYNADTQIRVMRCDKCKDQHWYGYKNLYP